MTNKRLTDNQIVMLMERCYKKEESIVVTQFNSDDTKTEITVDDILGIIYRQKAEIEALIAGQETLQKALAEKIAEIERLQKAGEEAVSCFHRMESLYNIKRVELKVAKAEAIKEFAEQLKSRTHEISCNVLQVVTKADIDNLVKEMTEPSLLDKKFGGAMRNDYFNAKP